MLTFSFQEALELSDVLEKRAGTEQRAMEKKALIDFAIFGHFKRGGWEEMAPVARSAMKGLGWGAGLAIPGVIGGNMLMNKARDNTEHVMHDARNQALILGGAKALGDAFGGAAKSVAGSMTAPNQFEHTQEETYPSGDMYKLLNTMKLSYDASLMEKLSVVMKIDEALEPLAVLDKSAQECLLINREIGVGLLKEMFR